MGYVTNHAIRHNGILFERGKEVPGLSYEDARTLLRHGAIKYVAAPPAPAPEPPAPASETSAPEPVTLAKGKTKTAASGEAAKK